jgi:pimeloyl-ACP methyl ester carboxylesterase
MPGMPIAEVNGQKLHYEIHGEGEPLLCVMGLGADSTAWMLQLPAFAERYRMIVFDNRDVGQSSYAEGDYRITDMAQDALALADQLELDSFHLLGVSMGGAISQELALSVPDRIKTLTLAVTWARSGRYAELNTRLLGRLMANATREEQIDSAMLLLFTEEFFEQPGAYEFAHNMLMANPNPQAPEAFVRQVNACATHNTLDRLGGLKMPTHVIGAARDTLVPVWKSEEIAAVMPEAKLSIVEGAAHGLQIESAQNFNELVLDFIGAQSGAVASAG